MYGPSEGEMKLLLGMAVVGVVTFVAIAVFGLVWLIEHVHVTF